MVRFLAISLDHPAHYASVGPFSVSAGNLMIIISMCVIFIVALFLPFPDHEKASKKSERVGGKR